MIDFSSFVTRKFVAAMGTALLMAICWVLCQWLPLAQNNFGTLVAGLGTALTAYTAGNVVQDHVMTRNAAIGDKAAAAIEKVVEHPPLPSKPA